ncbi:hypothetical protein GF376_05160 [Candidatus Peregrinibacteria bacterium]|nr:hypothetical protein [Candidatus Peregrinibacteria bacterium]
MRLLKKLKKTHLLILLIYSVVFANSSVLAQSGSSNFQIVDFVNSESELGESAAYQIEGSLDYYGGVSNNDDYVECTGNFAVMSDCGFPEKNDDNNNDDNGGSGSGGSRGGSASTGGSGGAYIAPGCLLGDPCSEISDDEEIVEEEDEVEEKKDEEIEDDVSEDFIEVEKEDENKPIQQRNVTDIETIEKSEIDLPLPLQITDKSIVDVEPSIEINEANQSIKVEEFQLVEIDQLRSAPTVIEVICEEEVCYELRGVAERNNQNKSICKIYSFGAYQFPIDCNGYILIAIILLIGALGIFATSLKKPL